MRIGVPKEIKRHEYRVGLMPASVRELAARGHEVLVETGAGDGIMAADEDYVRVGATLVPDAGAIFDACELIVKVKEPQRVEWERLSTGQTLFTYLHLAADPAQAEGLCRSGATAIAYETVTDDAGGLPLLAPMSEVAGRLAIEAAVAALRRHTGGRGLLLGGVPGVPPAVVVIIGGGVVGTQSARMAVGLGAEVVILDRSIPRLRSLDEMFTGRVRTRFATAAAVEEEAARADVVIGAVLVPGASAPRLISRADLSRLRRGAVLVDVAIDQGGCFETSRATTHDDPTFVVDGIVHYCVANMPGAVPLTSSAALNNATLPYVLALANGVDAALERDAGLRNGVNVRGGRLANSTVEESLRLAA